jgi:hypothetical protein
MSLLTTNDDPQRPNHSCLDQTRIEPYASLCPGMKSTILDDNEMMISTTPPHRNTNDDVPQTSKERW